MSLTRIRLALSLVAIGWLAFVVSGCTAEAGGIVDPNIDNRSDPLSISSADLGPYRAGVFTSDQLRANGGEQPHFWSMDEANALKLESLGLSLVGFSFVRSNPAANPPQAFQVISKSISGEVRISIPSALQPGNHRVTFIAEDASFPVRKSSTREVTIAIENSGGSVPNLPPVFTSVLDPAKLYHQVGTQYTATFTAVDPDGDAMIFDIDVPPSQGIVNFTQINANTIEFTWDGMTLNTQGNAETYNLTIGVTDQVNAKVTYPFCVVVDTPPTGAPCNQPPAFVNVVNLQQLPPAQQNVPYTFTVLARDQDSVPNEVILTLQQAPGGMTIDSTSYYLTSSNQRLTAFDHSVTPPVLFNPAQSVASSGGTITWLPTSADTIGTKNLTVRVDDQSGNTVDVQLLVDLQPGPPVPSNVRVALGNQHSSGSNQQWSFLQNAELMDPNIPSPTTGPVFEYQDGYFANGSSRLALTGPKHNLRTGGNIPHEVRLNSSYAYIQIPTFKAANPADPTREISIAARLYHHTIDEVNVIPTGSADVIVVYDSAGYAQLFDFGVNIHEEIHVPHRIASFVGGPSWNSADAFPMFVVTAEDGSKAWICRIDHRNQPNGTTANLKMVEVMPPAGVTIRHTTMNLIGTSNGAGSIYNLYFVGANATGQALYTAPIRNASAGVINAVQQTLEAGTGTTPSTMLFSEYVAVSGDGSAIAIVGGNDMTTSIGGGFPSPAPNPRLWRDIWLVDGKVGPGTSPNPTNRVTLYELATNGSISAQQPASTANDWRLIEVFDQYNTYQMDYVGAADTGGHDRRVLFGETVSAPNTTAVGHSLSYDGDLVAYVVNETNAGNADSTTENVHDEVYVASTRADAHTQLVRVTANNGISSGTDLAGSKMDQDSAFNINMGVCTGLFFPMMSGDDLRNRRLVFTFGYYTSPITIGPTNFDTPREQCTNVYTAEFTVGAPGAGYALTHESTADRSNGYANAAAAHSSGFLVPDADITGRTHRVILGTAEGADGNQGVLTMVVLGGTGLGAPTTGAPNLVLDPVARLFHLDLTSPNSAVSASTGTIQPTLDNTGSPISIFEVDKDRVHKSSGRETEAPYNTTTQTGFRYPHISHLFRSTPGPAHSYFQANSLTTIQNRLFVICTPNTGVDAIYVVPGAVPSSVEPSFNLSIVSTPGRIQDMEISWDAESVAMWRTILPATPATFQATPGYWFGSVYRDCDIYLMPFVSHSRSLVQSGGNPPAAVRAQVTSNTDLSRTGIWVDTSSLTSVGGATTFTRAFWFAFGGTGTANGSFRDAGMLTRTIAVEIPTTQVQSSAGPPPVFETVPNPNQSATVQPFSSVDSTQTAGAVNFFMAGKRP